MKRSWRVIGLAGAIALFQCLLQVGCDDRPTSVPQAVLEQASKPPSSTSKHPTTQDLLTGHRFKTALMPLPLTMDLPPGWGPMHDARLPNLYHGFTPSGEVEIQLSARSSMKPDELEALIKAARKEMAEKPNQIVKVDIRPLGAVRVLERQKIGVPAPFKTFDSNNVPHESIESNFTWTFDVIVPHDGAFQIHELNFIGLTKGQYDKDKEFLQSIVSTMGYASDAAAAANNPTLPNLNPSTRPAATTAPLP